MRNLYKFTNILTIHEHINSLNVLIWSFNQQTQTPQQFGWNGTRNQYTRNTILQQEIWNILAKELTNLPKPAKISTTCTKIHIGTITQKHNTLNWHHTFLLSQFTSLSHIPTYTLTHTKMAPTHLHSHKLRWENTLAERLWKERSEKKNKLKK